jgi:transposase InsO family protein
MADQTLTEQIETIHQDSRRSYGSPRIYETLAENGVQCGRNRVARLMREVGLAAKQSRKFKIITTDSHHNDPIAPNLLDRDFSAEQPNQKWLTDITSIPTDEGWL